MPDPAQTGAPATPPAPGATGPAQSGPTNDGQTGAAQTGAAQTGAAQTGPSGATGASGPSGATGAAATGAAQKTLNDLKDAAEAAKKAYKDNPTPENKAAAEKAVSEAKQALKSALGETAPDKYELKLPQDSVLDAAHLERIAAEAKARGLSNEDAQALLERDNGLFGIFAKEEKARVEGYISGWLNDSKADKEIGGENFAKNSELAYRVIERFGTKEFKDALSSTGLGNHPELVRVFVKIGQAMGSDQFIPAKGGDKTQQSLADKFYGEGKTENKTE